MRSLLRALSRRRQPYVALHPRNFAQQPTRLNSTTNKPTTGPEAPPFHGYLIDALDAPLHTIAPATRTSPTSPPPPQTDEESKIAKARVVFGSRLAGPAERKREIDKLSTNIAGVMVPPRPEEPDNCCMSGCVNCVWDLYRDEMEEWAEAKKRAGRVRLEEARAAAEGMDEDGGGSGMWRAGEDGGGGDLFEGIPVGIREFMRTEKKLKERRGREEGVGVGAAG